MPRRYLRSLMLPLALGTIGGHEQLRAQATATKPLPNVVVLATGGTIAGAAATDVQAGYTSGDLKSVV